MSLIETLTIHLGAAIGKSVLKLWLKDTSIAKNPSLTTSDILQAKIDEFSLRRPTTRLFDRVADETAEQLAPVFQIEGAHLPENEREAVALAVAETFEGATISEEVLLKRDLDPFLLERHLRRAMPSAARKLAEPARELYDKALQESCSYAVEIANGLPSWQLRTTRELFRRETESLLLLSKILESMPVRRQSSGDAEEDDWFETQYVRRVAHALDTLELFGISVPKELRRYSLSVAYIALTVESDQLADERELEGGRLRVDTALGRARRTLIRGAPGSGKTTLLQWLAVHLARRELSKELDSWNGLVPFFIRLRSYVGRELPSPDEFLEGVARNTQSLMPDGWVHRKLQSGAAAVLVDGVDELPHARRSKVQQWIFSLVNEFPRSRFVVTSRAPAVSDDWLDEADFDSLELQPLSFTDLRRFVDHWHEAAVLSVLDEEERSRLATYGRTLKRNLSSDDTIRSLATNPLLCAMLCALNVDWKSQLPNDRMELYRVALDNLLERRDAEREIQTGYPFTLSRGQKETLLRELAYWLLLNNQVDASREAIEAQIARFLAAMPNVTGKPHDILQYLLERSGVVREPAVSRVDFVHRTFQEYLSAKAAIERNDIGLLIEKSADDQWREVIVLAAGHASTKQRNDLLKGILSYSSTIKAGRRHRQFLAMRCRQIAVTLDPTVSEAIDKASRNLFPPRSFEDVEDLAAAGDSVVPLLAGHSRKSPLSIAACVRTLTRIGTPKAMFALAEYGISRHREVMAELVQAWEYFDQEAFGQEVMVRCRFVGPLRWEGRESIAGIESLRCLQHFECTRSPRLTSLEPLRTIDDLRELVLDGCTGLSNAGPLSDLGRLEYVSLQGCFSLDDLTPLSGLKELCFLDLTGCRDITNLTPLSKLTKLETLHLYDCHGIRSLSPLEGLPSLARLSISEAGLLETLSDEYRERLEIDW